MNISTDLPDYSITEPALAAAAELDRIKKIQVIETAAGFYVLATIQGRPHKTLCLVTQRVTDSPRMFKDLKRLNDLLRSIYPNGPIELICEEIYVPIR